MSKSKYVTQHQFQPPKVPAEWKPDEKRYAQQVEELIRYLYSRFNRLRLEDMNDGFRLMLQGMEDHYASLELRLQGFAAAIDGNRLEFTASGLDVKNTDGEKVFEQDIATGNLTITGTIYADAGNIGGLSILNGILTNGDITLDMNNGVVTARRIRMTEPDSNPQAVPVGVDDNGWLHIITDLPKTAFGTATVVDGTPASVDIDGYGFTEPPVVTATYGEQETAGLLSVDGVSELGFSIYGTNTTARAVNWIAIGR